VASLPKLVLLVHVSTLQLTYSVLTCWYVTLLMGAVTCLEFTAALVFVGCKLVYVTAYTITASETFTKLQN